MKGFWSRNKFSTVIVVYILLVVPAIYFSARLLAGKIRTTSDSIQESLIDAQIEKSKIENIPGMKSTADKIKDNQEALDVILDESQEVDFIKSLESLADETGNKISITVNDPKDAPPAAAVSADVSARDKKPVEKDIKDTLSHKKSISMNVELGGNYDSLISFIHKLENDKYYANVVSVDSRKGSVAKGQAGISGNSGIFLSPSNQVAADPNQENAPDALKTTLVIIVYLK